MSGDQRGCPHEAGAPQNYVVRGELAYAELEQVLQSIDETSVPELPRIFVDATELVVESERPQLPQGLHAFTAWDAFVLLQSCKVPSGDIPPVAEFLRELALVVEPRRGDRLRMWVSRAVRSGAIDGPPEHLQFERVQCGVPEKASAGVVMQDMLKSALPEAPEDVVNAIAAVVAVVGKREVAAADAEAMRGLLNLFGLRPDAAGEAGEVTATAPPDVQLLTVAEVASIMHVSKMTVYRLIQSGHLPAIHIGRTKRVPKQAVREYLRENVACS